MRAVTPFPDDEALVPGLACQDPAAVEALLERYWERTWRVALQLVGDPAAAEDVAQEALVEAIRSAPRFQPGARLRPWLFGILRNLASRRQRGAGRRTAHEARAAITDERSTRVGPAEAAETAERLELLREGLEQIDPRFREALVLRYLEGLSLAETAEALGCPEGTVSSRIRRGQEALREALAPTMALSGIPGLEWLLGLGSKVRAPHPPAALELLATIGPAGVALAPAAPAVQALLAAVRRGGSALPLLGVLLLVAVGGLLAGRALLGPDEVASAAGTGRVASASGTAASGTARASGPGGNAPDGAEDALPADSGPRLALSGRLVAPVLDQAWVALHSLESARELRRSRLGEVAEGLGRPLGGWAVPRGATPVGADGAFALDVPDGDWLVVAGARGCVTRAVQVELAGPGAVTIELARVEPAALQLRALDCHGQPFQGARLRMSLQPPGGAIRLADLGPLGTLDAESLSLELPTGDDGRVAGLTLPPGRWGYSWVRVSEHQGMPHEVLDGAIELAAGREVALDLATAAEASTCWIRVSVVDRAGRPVEGASVKADAVVDVPRPDPIHEYIDGDDLKYGDHTGPLGRVTLRKLSTRTWQVFARQGFLGGRSEALHLHQGGAGREVRIVLDEPIATGHVRVTLVDAASGEPLPGSFRFSLRGPSGSPEGSLSFPRDFVDLVAGEEHSLVVHGQGYSRTLARFRPEVGKTIEVAVRLARATVTPGTVVAPPGEAIPPHTRVAASRRSRHGDVAVDEAEVGPDGAFQLGLSGAPPFDLELKAPGWAAVRLEGWDPASSAARLVLDPEAPSLRVQVLDPSGQPVPGVDVHFRRGEPIGGEWYPTETDAAGQAVWRGLSGPERRVNVDVRPGRRDWLQPRASEAATLGAGRTEHTIRLHARPALVPLRGRIVDLQGAPLAAVWLNLSSSVPGTELSEHVNAQTADDGTFTAEVLAGELRLHAARGDRPSVVRQLTVPGSGLDGVQVVMARGSKVAGRLSGEVLGGWKAHVRASPVPADGRETRFAQVASGRFDLGAMAAGEWEVSLDVEPTDRRSRADVKTSTRRVTLLEGVDELELTLDPP